MFKVVILMVSEDKETSYKLSTTVVMFLRQHTFWCVELWLKMRRSEMLIQS